MVCRQCLGKVTGSILGCNSELAFKGQSPALLCPVDELVDPLRPENALMLPQFWKHTNRCEAGECVDLIEYETPSFVAVPEIQS